MCCLIFSHSSLLALIELLKNFFCYTWKSSLRRLLRVTRRRRTSATESSIPVNFNVTRTHYPTRNVTRKGSVHFSMAIPSLSLSESTHNHLLEPVGVVRVLLFSNVAQKTPFMDWFLLPNTIVWLFIVATYSYSFKIIIIRFKQSFAHYIRHKTFILKSNILWSLLRVRIYWIPDRI